MKEQPANQLETIAAHAKAKGRNSQHVFKSKNLAMIGSVLAISIGLAWTPTSNDPQHPENPKIEEANPLQSPLFEFNYSKDVGEPAAGELNWDDAFLNQTHWDKLPPAAGTSKAKPTPSSNTRPRKSATSSEDPPAWCASARTPKPDTSSPSK